MAEEKKQWAMPGWMEPYRKYLDRYCGGIPAEELMNDTETTMHNNIIRIGVIIGCEHMVNMLMMLHADGELKEVS